MESTTSVTERLHGSQSLNALLIRQAAWLREQLKAGSIGFMQGIMHPLEFMPTISNEIHAWAVNPDVIVFGVGGSDLGARALVQALITGAAAHPDLTTGMGDGTARFNGRLDPKIMFAGDTTDFDAWLQVQAQVEERMSCPTVLVLVSKSGGTLEPTSAFVYAHEWFRKNCWDFKVVFVTDPEAGVLRKNAHLADWTFPIPTAVGGRFSVFTAAGVLPLLIAGYGNIVYEFLRGGQAAVENCLSPSPDGEFWPAVSYGVFMATAYDRGLTVQPFATYDTQLELVAWWWQQLWGESLGKKSRSTGRRISVTPMTLQGPKWHHSMLQRFSLGACGTVITFLKVKNPRYGGSRVVPADTKMARALCPDLGGKSYDTLLRAQYEGVVQALDGNGVPNVVIEVPEVTPATLGELLMHLMLATFVAADCLDVDPEGQPGVEATKVITKGILGSG